MPGLDRSQRKRGHVLSAFRGFYGAKAVATLLALGALASPEAAHAQDKTFYLDRLYVGGAPDDGIGVWRPHTAEKFRFYGQAGADFGLNPFRHENHRDNPTLAARIGQEKDNPVVVQTNLFLTAGLEALDRFGFQIQLPITVFQTGGGTSSNSVPGKATDPNAAAAGDLKLEARAVLARTASRAFKVGVLGAVWAPTGNQLAYAGDLTAHAHLQLGAEYDLKKVFFVINSGVHFRGPMEVNDFRLGNEWTWGIGGYVPLRDGALRLGAQVFGSTGLRSGTVFDGDNTPIEWLAEARLALDKKKQGFVSAGGGTRLTAGYAPDFRLAAFIGYSFGLFDTDPAAPGKKFKVKRSSGADTDKDGLPDDVDLCPTEAEDGKPPNTDDGCPALPDKDGDGIPDISDKCPDQPEDFDKIDDSDGCPEDDADKDGIADAKDACPKEPGEPSPEPAKNGCPQFIRRISGSSEIQILQQIQFQTGSAVILPGSYKILDEVVRLLKVNPEIKHLAIEGHTDNRGSDELNTKLSNLRANSVKDYLVNKGIDASRLSAAGFGPAKPIDTNETAEGRQKNRRVEFHIRGQEIKGIEKKE